ncbi:hypothetical protein AALB16_09200 [Lachnospiraceae bacterium 62-35]
MKDKKQRDKMATGNSGTYKYLRLLVIPVIAFILILVIVIADKSPKTEIPDGETVDLLADSSFEETSEEQAGSADNFVLSKNEIPEISALMERYCQAKADCDAETMYELYGKTDTEGIEELRSKMQWRAKYIESFQNITSYTIPGLDENSYLVYVSADIKFHVTDTLAPNLMWCYVTKNQSGTFIIVENVPREVLVYVAQAEKSEGVRLLAQQINARLEEAAASDSKLASAYGMQRKGAPAPGDETTAAMGLETTAGESRESEENPEESSSFVNEASMEDGTVEETSAS